MRAAVFENRALGFAVDGPAGRIVRRVDVNRARSGLQRRQQALEVERPAFGREAERKSDRFGAEDLGNFHQVRPDRRDDHHAVTRPHQRLSGQHERRHAGTGYRNAVGSDLPGSAAAMKAGEIIADSVSQFRDAEILRIEGLPSFQSVDSGPADEIRGDLIRFAEPECDHIFLAHRGVGDFADLRRAKLPDYGAGGEGKHGRLITIGKSGIFSYPPRPVPLPRCEQINLLCFIAPSPPPLGWRRGHR